MPRLFIDIEARFAKFEDSLNRIRSSSERTARSIESAFGGVRNVLGALGVAAGAGGLALHFKGLIDFADELNTIHERTAIAVKDLVGLKFAAEQVDASFSDIQIAAKGLGKAISEAGTGNRDLQQLFEDLQMRDAKQGIGEFTDTLLKLAEVFPRFSSGDQLRILRNLRIPVELAPLLRQGRQELEKLIATGQKVNKPFTDEFVKNADEFGDRMKVVSAVIKQTGSSLVNDLLPPVNEVLKAFQEGAIDKGGGLVGGLEAAGKRMQEFSSIFAVATGVILENSKALGTLALAFAAIAGGRAVGAAITSMVAWTAATKNSISSSLTLIATQRQELQTAAIIAENSRRMAAQRVVEAQATVAASQGMARLTATQLALIPAQQALAAATTRAAAAQTAATAATARGSVAAVAAARVLGFLGGPIGAIITGLSLAALAWEVFGNNAETAGEKAKKASQDSARGIQSALRQLEDNKLVEATGNTFAPAIEAERAALKQLADEIQRIRDETLSAGGGLGGADVDSLTADAERVVAPLVAELNARSAALDKVVKASQAQAAKANKPGGLRLTPDGLPQAQFDARLKDLERGVQAEARIFQEQNELLEAAYDRGTVNLQQFVADQKDILDTYVTNTSTKLREQRTLLEGELKRTTNPRDRIKLEQELKDLDEKSSKLKSQAFLQTVRNEDKAIEKTLEHQRAVQELNAEIEELLGNSARAIEIRLRIREQGSLKLLADPEAKEAFNRARALEIAFGRATEIERKASLESQKLHNAEDEVLSRVRRGQITEIEGMQQISDERKKSIVELERLSDLYRRLSEENPFNEQLRVQAETFRIELQKLKDEADVLRDAFANMFSGSFSRALQDLVQGKGTFKDIMKSFFIDVGDQITAFVADSLSKQLFSKEGALGGIADFFGGIFGGTLGTGGPEQAAKALAASHIQATGAAGQLTIAMTQAAAAAQSFAVRSGSGSFGSATDVAGSFSADYNPADYANFAQLAFGAKGLAFRKFRHGDVFSAPTLFRFAHGSAMSIGMMGEGGPEAVMPLRRGRDGKLGVSAAGSSVTNNFYTSTPADPRTQAQIARMAGAAVARASRRDG